MLTAERLRELLDYNPATGDFTWRVATSSRAVVGRRAGTTQKAGYVVIRIARAYLYAHRLAWLYATGEWPNGQIDHKNCDKSDNRLDNLRVATHAENQANVAGHRDNTSGYKGVYFSKYHRRWHARIRVPSDRRHGAQRHLGYFPTAKMAHAAYAAAAHQMYGEFARPS